jgi:hypothetical protein
MAQLLRGNTQLRDATVTLAKLQDVSTGTILGRGSAGSGVLEELSAQNVREILGLWTDDDVTFNSLTLSGDLTVNGTATYVNTTNLSVEDSLIQLGNNNDSTDVVDIGLVGLYDTSGSQDLYTGLFRDASDDKWKLFTGSQEDLSATNVVDTGAAGYTKGTLQANIEGDILFDNDVTFELTGDITGSATFDGTNNVSISTSYAGAISLDALSDVGVDSPSIGQILMYDATNSVWENASISASGDVNASYDEAGSVTLSLNPGSTPGLMYISSGSAMVKVRRVIDYVTVDATIESNDYFDLANDGISGFEPFTEVYLNGFRQRYGASREFTQINDGSGGSSNRIDFVESDILTAGDQLEVVYFAAAV